MTGYQSKKAVAQAIDEVNWADHERDGLARPAQKPVAWPCLVDTADFSKKTVTIIMQCDDYTVSAGTHWLSTTPPQEST